MFLCSNNYNRFCNLWQACGAFSVVKIAPKKAPGERLSCQSGCVYFLCLPIFNATFNVRDYMYQYPIEYSLGPVDHQNNCPNRKNRLFPQKSEQAPLPFSRSPVQKQHCPRSHNGNCQLFRPSYSLPASVHSIVCWFPAGPCNPKRLRFLRVHKNKFRL